MANPNRELLQSLTLRASRLVRLIQSEVPAVLLRNEAFLILSAALRLEEGKGAKLALAEWIVKHPGFAADGGTLVDLRNDTIDECVEVVSMFEDESDRQFSTAIQDVAEKVAELKTSRACADLEGIKGARADMLVFDEAPTLAQIVEPDPAVTYAVILDEPSTRGNPEVEAFLKVAIDRGFSVKIDDKTIRVRAHADRGPELEALRAACFDSPEALAADAHRQYEADLAPLRKQGV